MFATISKNDKEMRRVIKQRLLPLKFREVTKKKDVPKKDHKLYSYHLVTMSFEPHNRHRKNSHLKKTFRGCGIISKDL